MIRRDTVYALHLSCASEEVDHLSVELWEAGTQGIQEIDSDAAVRLIAAFATDESREELLGKFAPYSPAWRDQDTADWVERTEAAWPAREIGRKIFLAAPWNQSPTPPERIRIMHNPGLACGTGEHACTQLALKALEQCVTPGCRVVDIGTGSGILAIAAWRLGAGFAVGIDNDEAALTAARGNFALNDVPMSLAAGSADCISAHCADVVVANINASVLLSILDELMMIIKPNGWLILTGFEQLELATLQKHVPAGQVLSVEEWRCLTVRML